MNIRYLRCDNAGEHKEVEKICEKEGITMEYTAPYTPQQNGRVERKLNVIWQRALTMMVNANMTRSAQNDFWAEAASCAAYLENLTIKKGRNRCALEEWSGEGVRKWMMKLVEFGRTGVLTQKKKFKGKMKQKGIVVLMCGYAANHGPGAYRVFVSSTDRIRISRDVNWGDFSPRRMDDDLAGIYGPGVIGEGDNNGGFLMSESDSVTMIAQRVHQQHLLKN